MGTIDIPDEIQSALQSLPACHRCHRLRKKCDSQLPACRLCEKAKVECSVYDHILQRSVPRKYIRSLVSRLDGLKEVHTSLIPPAKLVEPDKGNTGCPALASQGSTSASSSIRETFLPAGSETNSDYLFTLPTASGTMSRFYGSSSIFSLTVEVLTEARARSLYTPSPALESVSPTDESFGALTDFHGLSADRNLKKMVPSLLTWYLSSIGVVYPFVDQELLKIDMTAYFELRSCPGFDAGKLQGKPAYQYFRVTIMCAIACASKMRHQRSLLAHADAFYHEALKLVEAVTYEVSVDSLEALLFLGIYCLFFPRKGNIWKLLDFACRLSIQLNYHVENHASLELGREGVARRDIFWTLYSIERLLGQYYGRPSDLPGSIISTAHPSTFPSHDLNQGDNDAAIQTFCARHVSRLMYLRGELYTDMYLRPDLRGPIRSLDWFINKYFELHQWFQEVEPFKHSVGCGTLTCSVAFHSAVVFLFQPLILRALSGPSSGVSTEGVESEPVPSESFYSACELIRIHDSILRAPENSNLGTYPLTFLSAYSIWSAAMTLMAHALLTLDGRVETLCHLSDVFTSVRTEKLPYGSNDIFGLSSMCLVLLGWCGEQWPGMAGMTDAYRRLSQQVLPLLLQNGHV
ncbi:uncharacterized protein Z520_01456 [Fonsecaea multimorphosa CBS 102226]|uniref:Zn(2)-C6 fungal-type domain-containing protein n=1 Tax=Fonsecaea multimorphosa CBS 102226 TaxID=1442371 RepID=A0A0D2KHS7_9EURO|nr:uncharacterized protein Z520_01456 [Fonsecaea multimorphosa CBS 102226]KIY02990.1 hypothetical protein Z520_01456 [Fonsecaea multimorphosa CBS 102226]OAL30820.1 hypothetical protein AYO22_01440 [Fonsecaea multimorphosa]